METADQIDTRITWEENTPLKNPTFDSEEANLIDKNAPRCKIHMHFYYKNRGLNKWTYFWLDKINWPRSYLTWGSDN